MIPVWLKNEYECTDIFTVTLFGILCDIKIHLSKSVPKSKTKLETVINISRIFFSSPLYGRLALFFTCFVVG